MKLNDDHEKLLTSFLEENTVISSENEKTYFEAEESIWFAIKGFQEKSMFSDFIGDSSAELDIAKAEKIMAKEPKYKVPEYLKNYVNMNLNSKSENSESVVVRIVKEGVRFINSAVDSVFKAETVLLPAMRSPEKQDLQAVNLYADADGNQITYQLIKESSDEAYLCINFDGTGSLVYSQVNLKKNNRFIYSEKISQSKAVSFSGLKQGKYNLEFVGAKGTKSVDLTILAE